MESAKAACVILGAGYSSRMGAFKPLLPVGGRPALARVIRSAKEAGFEHLLCVTGFKREELLPLLKEEGVDEAYNRDFDKGMFSSIQTGVAAAQSSGRNGEGFLLMLVDCPLVGPQVIRKILDAHRLHPDAFIVPCYLGKKGHPIFIPQAYGEEILSFQGKNGLKGVMNRHEDKLLRLETGDESVVLDMDTKDGYQEVLAYLEEKPPLEFHGTIWLVRHGQTRQHEEKIYLGQTDVPLNDEGRDQARAAGLFLDRHGVSRPSIYCSDLSRARETAEILRDTLAMAGGSQPVCLQVEKGLREMHLGDWDGRFIREVREAYPEEYEKRGKNLLTFKKGHEGENFYDLRYRAVKCLEKILRQEGASGEKKDLVIVTHAGVIRVLQSSLQGIPLEDGLELAVPKGSVTSLNFD